MPMISDPSDLDGRPPVSGGCVKIAIAAMIIFMIFGLLPLKFAS